MPAKKAKRAATRHKKKVPRRRARKVTQAKLSRACWFHRHDDCNGMRSRVSGTKGAGLACRCPCH